MFVLKSTHLSEIKRLEAELALTRTILDYQERRYQAQIEDLRQLVFPKTTQTVHPLTMEADNVISGNDKPLEQSEEERNRFMAGERELALITSDNYSEDLLN